MGLVTGFNHVWPRSLGDGKSEKICRHYKLDVHHFIHYGLLRSHSGTHSPSINISYLSMHQCWVCSMHLRGILHCRFLAQCVDRSQWPSVLTKPDLSVLSSSLQPYLPTLKRGLVAYVWFQSRTMSEAWLVPRTEQDHVPPNRRACFKFKNICKGLFPLCFFCVCFTKSNWAHKKERTRLYEVQRPNVL